MGSKRTGDSDPANLKMVEVTWDELDTGDFVYTKLLNGYHGPLKVLSAKECVILDPETNLRWHQLGRGLYALR